MSTDMRVAEEMAKFQRPIPGQSLTNDPENPAAYEKPPQFTNLKQAQEWVFGKLIEEDTYVPMMNLLDSGEASVMELTQNLLYQGFRAGKWNPDMMLLLAEPVAYMFMALAERAEIDFRIDDEPDEDEDSTDISSFKEAIASKAPESKKVPQGALPKEIEDKIDEAPTSLLAPQTQSEPAAEVLNDNEGVDMPPEEESLLG
jgi:hypothetical protein